MKIYCIHEQTNLFASRMKLFKKQLDKINHDYELILITSFPASEFSPENQSPYNQLHLSSRASEKSCFWKHYDALRKIAESNCVGLVLEDDAIFKSNLLSECNELLAKVADKENFYINIEYDNVDVPIWLSKKTLVKVNSTKRAGGYLVSPKAASKICDEIEDYLNKKKPYYFLSDGFITEHWQKAQINLFWSVNPMVWQGSKSGRFSSNLSFKEERPIYHKMYEPLLLNALPTFNKIRACFRAKVKNKILEAI